MNENIDLTKILKNCPKGFKLYSLVHGEVTFLGISEVSNIYSINVKVDGVGVSYTFDGKIHHHYGGECVLFPSKEQRDWSKFTAPWLKKERFNPKTLKVFDRVLVRFDCGAWSATLFSHLIDSKFANKKYDIICCGSVFGYCIPYNDDTKHLVGTKEEAAEYYRYWED